MEKREKHFVLVHGACHGAWCWYKVATLLKLACHKVTALDMAGCGRHPKQFHEVSSHWDYFEPLLEFMATLPPEERAILVGHSFGGLSISAAMERFPEKVSVAVFCTAFMPGLDFSSSSLAEERVNLLLLGPNFMASKLYQLSSAEDLTLAMFSTRPHPIFKDLEMRNKAVTLTKENYGSVQRVYIACDQDNIIKEDLQRLMIEKTTTDEVKLIPGSDHMPMFSKPKELCNCLHEVALKYT